MLREPSAPSGPRPAIHNPPSPTKTENRVPTGTTAKSSRIAVGREPPSVPSKLPSYDASNYTNTGGSSQTNGTTDFLPTLSFDELHSSIIPSVDDFATDIFSEVGKEQFETGTMIVERNTARSHTMETGGMDGVTNSTRAIPTRTRAGSLITRRQSLTNRQASISSTTSIGGPSDASNVTTRTRRTQYPPLSSNNNASKGPRKSLLSSNNGGSEGDGTRITTRRRPSLINSVSATPSAPIQSMSDVVAAGRAIGATSDATPRILVPRASKAKSLQPPSRQNTQPAIGTPSATPDRTRSSSFASKSPVRPRQPSTTPSSAAKRMSVMPGLPASNSHASGLGARTVSPTDARRLKRLSMLQGVPPMPHAPPEGSFQAAMAGRTPSSSPGPKTSTPCSLQTTPDLSRRSYIATSTNGGFTPRSSTQSLQPRLAQMPSMSRLPTPKTRNPPSSNDDEDTPPPVPAIPKQYESPKDAPVDQSMFSLRKSHLPYDSASLNSRNSSSTNEWSATSSGKERAIKVKSMGPLPRSSFMSGSRTDAEQKSKVTPVKKQLQPLRLPPLNLLPLSTPTAAKISQMTSDPSKQVHGRQTPPGRVAAKTPSTPMTASKTSFFSSRSRAQQPTVASQSRSSTSTSHQRQGTGQESPSKPIPAPARPPRQNAVSPFVSSSLPKSSGEHHFFGRSKPSVDSTHDTTTEQRQSRVNGPRAQQKLTKSPKREQAPPRSPPKTDAEPTGSSIRRKLSLSWKRGNSKSSITLVNDKEAADVPPQPPKHDSKYGDMPPPRLPASATTGNLANYTNTRSPKKIAPSPSDSLRSVKSTKSTTNYLDTKRRKSSLSNNDPAVMQQREEQKLQDKWGLTEQSTTKPQVAERKLTALPTDTPKHNLSSSRSSSAIVNSTQRILGPKPSMMSLRPSIERERWTEGLDKDDLIAEEEIRRLAMRRKETEQAARVLDALMKRATPKDRVSPRTALESGARLNIFERGEIVDFRDVYFCGTSSADKHVGDSQNTNNNHGYDDERGDYGIVIGDHLSYRYEIIDVLGKGSFGQVVRCIDHKTGLLVAVKIIRNKKRFHQQALVEVDILQKLRDWDPKGQHSLIHFTSSFYFRGHLCISTELLSMNLYEFIKMNSFRGFSLRLIRRFTKQLLSSLLLLKKQRVIHCDLKPENILLTHPGHSEIKVIDFGSSCFEEQQVYTYIQSRFYRSPEVILGLEYGLPIDMWSVGCILAELFTGYPIFPGENETEQLACIMEVFGPPGQDLVARSSRRKLFFDGRGNPRVSVSSKGRRRRVGSKTLNQVLKCEDDAFLDFLTGCLKWDPSKRLKPEEGVLHPFITGRKVLTAARGARDRESPVKRFNSLAVPPSAERIHSSRPLPQPPTASGGGVNKGRIMTEMGGTHPSARNPSSSPAKAQGSRRISNMSFANPTLSNARKRESFGGNITQLPGGGGLPRLRGASGQVKTDLASAAASAAVSKR